MISALAGAHLAEALLEAGDADGCRERLLAAAGGPGLELIEPSARARHYEILVRAELAGGHAGAARDWLERGEATLGDAAHDLRRSELLRARAAVLLAEGEVEPAREAAAAAAQAAELAGVPIAAARARILLGRALAAAARRQAVVELESAVAALAACGARRYEDEAVRELRRLGRRVTRAATGFRHPPAQPAGARGGRARRGRQDEPRDRRGALPERAHDRDTPAPHLRQARRLVTSGRRRRGGAGPRVREPSREFASALRCPRDGRATLDGRAGR